MNLSEVTIEEVNDSKIYIGRLIQFLNVPDELYGAGKGGFFQRNRDNLDYFVKDVRPYFQKTLQSCSTPKERNLVKCIWDNTRGRIIGFLHPNLQIHSGYVRNVVSEEERAALKAEKVRASTIKIACQLVECGKIFQTTKRKKMSRFCGENCRAKARRLKKKHLTLLENPYRVSI